MQREPPNGGAGNPASRRKKMANVLVVNPRRKTIESVFMTSAAQMFRALEITEGDETLITRQRVFGLGGYLYAQAVFTEDDEESLPEGHFTDFPGDLLIWGPCVVAGNSSVFDDGLRPSDAIMTADQLREIIAWREVTSVSGLSQMVEGIEKPKRQKKK
jgi:hypothetical protein